MIDFFVGTKIMHSICGRKKKKRGKTELNTNGKEFVYAR